MKSLGSGLILAAGFELRSQHWKIIIVFYPAMYIKLWRFRSMSFEISLVAQQIPILQWVDLIRSGEAVLVK